MTPEATPPASERKNFAALGREEFYRLSRHQRFYVTSFEAEALDTGDDAPLELGIAKLAGQHLRFLHLTRRRDGQLHHQLALQSRVVAQGTVVQGIERTFVAIEHEFDFFPATRGFAAVAIALH